VLLKGLQRSFESERFVLEKVLYMQTAREGGKLLPLTRFPELFLETFIVVVIAYSLNILEYVFTRSGFEDL